MDSNDVYKERAESVLVLLSDLYLDEDSVSVSDSRPSSCSAYTVTNYFCLLTTALRKV